MNYLFFIILFACHSIVLSVPVSIVKSLNEFLYKCVPENNREKFRSYYENLIKEIKDLKGSEKKAYLDSIRHIGCTFLEKRNQRLFEQIKPYMHGPNPKIQCFTEFETKEIKLFLFRYGALEKYNDEQLIAQTKPWNRVNSYIKGLGNRISCWFNSIKINPFA